MVTEEEGWALPALSVFSEDWNARSQQDTSGLFLFSSTSEVEQAQVLDRNGFGVHFFLLGWQSFLAGWGTEAETPLV